jgi:hypothetical protein
MQVVAEAADLRRPGALLAGEVERKPDHDLIRFLLRHEGRDLGPWRPLSGAARECGQR